MGKTGEDADASPVTIGKKSKKSKNKINDLQDVDGEGNSQVDLDVPKDKKGHEHRKKKKKKKNKESESNDNDKGNLVHDADIGQKKKKKRESGSNEDGVEDRPDKVDDANLEEKKKKRESESESNEDGVEDRPDKGNLVEGADLGEKKKKKKKKKRDSGSNEDGAEDRPYKGNLVEDADLGEKTKKKKKRESGSNEDGAEDRPYKGNLVNDGDVSKKDKKKKRKRYASEETQIEENEDNQKDGPELSSEDSVSEKSDNKKRKSEAQNSDTEMKEIMTEESTPETQDDAEDKKGTNEKKKTNVKSKAQNKTTEPVKNNTGNAKAKGKGKSKKVSFSGQVEVFPSSDTGPRNQTTKGDGLIRGKRFTPEEDEIIKDAVNNYITDNNLGDDGLSMVLNCSTNHIKKCWQEIGKCIPYRPHSAVYSRAHILLERSEAKGSTPEEEETLRKYVEKHGHKWKKIGQLMGKHRVHVKDIWRRIKPENAKAGKWEQQEYQTVYDLVNKDLKVRVHCEKKSKHGMLKDNIPWGAISEKLATRSDASCCSKWYKLSSSLVANKLWSDADDYRMIGKLYELDAACVDDVDWDNLLEHRPGDICRKRWDQMVKHIGDYGSKPFSEQVDVLAERYLPDLAETREAWDNKPYVS